MAATLEV